MIPQCSLQSLELAVRARSCISDFAGKCLGGGTGPDMLITRNQDATHPIRFSPLVLAGTLESDTDPNLFGRRFDVPFGSVPVGISGLIWPGSEKSITTAAARRNFPYRLSMAVCETPKAIAAIAGEGKLVSAPPVAYGGYPGRHPRAGEKRRRGDARPHSGRTGGQLPRTAGQVGARLTALIHTRLDVARGESGEEPRHRDPGARPEKQDDPDGVE